LKPLNDWTIVPFSEIFCKTKTKFEILLMKMLLFWQKIFAKLISLPLLDDNLNHMLRVDFNPLHARNQKSIKNSEINNRVGTVDTHKE